MKKPKKEKWKAIKGEGHPFRYVVDQNNMLVADCYADSSDKVGLPDGPEYKKLAKRIAMLPDIIRALEGVYGKFPELEKLLARYNKLR